MNARYFALTLAALWAVMPGAGFADDSSQRGDLRADGIQRRSGQPVQLPVIPPSATPPRDAARTLGSRPAVIGGGSLSQAKNNAVVNGTGMKHRP